MSPSRLVVISLVAAFSALAQPRSGAPPVTGGHIHLNSADPDAAIAFWKEILGAPTVTVDSEKGIGMSGATILFTRVAPSGPSTGTSIDHLGLRVADVQPFIDRLAKTTWKSFAPKDTEDRLMIEGPDGVRIELIGDSAMYTSLEYGHTHLQSKQPKEMQTWYVQNFGGRAGAGENTEALQFPGAAFMVSEGESSAPTSGRAIDHISFEVKDLDAFCKKLTSNGVKLDTPSHPEPRIGGSVALLTDPWGTRIELTEHLAK